MAIVNGNGDVIKPDTSFTTNLDKVKQASNPGTSETSAKTLADNFDTFLLLLTTQLKNQDPTAPLDTNQFTQQLVSFSGVEQAIATNKNLEKLISFSQGGQINNAVGYIGRQVNATGSQNVLSGGKATFTYELPSVAASNTIAITDALGQIVYTTKGETKAGQSTLTWDGTNSFNGVKQPDGVYKITVQAKDSKGKDLEAKTFTTGRVTSVGLENGDVTLSLGTIDVKLDDVISITEIPATTTATTTPPKTGNSSGS